MERQRYFDDWLAHYTKMERGAAIIELKSRLERLTGRMKHLARLSQRQEVHGIPIRSLQYTLGLSLGIHQQILRGLTSSPRGCYPERVVGGIRSRTSAKGASLKEGWDGN